MEFKRETNDEDCKIKNEVLIEHFEEESEPIFEQDHQKSFNDVTVRLFTF